MKTGEETEFGERERLLREHAEKRRLRPSHAKVRSTPQARPLILNARWPRLVMIGRQPLCSALAITIRIAGKRARKPPGNHAPARWSGTFAGSTRLAMGGPRVSTNMCRFLPRPSLSPPKPEIIVYRAPGWKASRQQPPLTACPEHMERGIEHAA